MKTTLLILLLSAPCWGASQKYGYKDPHLNDEIGAIYKALSNPTDFVDVRSFTKAQISGMTPKRAGRIYFCSDCTTDAIVVSTGTTLGAFSRISARTTSIQ